MERVLVERFKVEEGGATGEYANLPGEVVLQHFPVVVK
jgi:hypothetical protein